MRPEDVLIRAGRTVDGEIQRLAGGDMAEVWRVGSAVVKMGADHPEQFAAEACGLRALIEAGIRAPEVFFADESALVMAYLEPGPSQPAALGTLISELHGVRGERYGSEASVFIGRFRLAGGWSDGAWSDFWATQRIQPLLRATWSTLGGLGPRVERLLREYAPPVEGPVLLHGDLWSGNVYASSDGPALIDPSVWWGERGVDLAMMGLFGGFGGQCMQAYQRATPIPQEVQEAVEFYQLYYLLVHVHFFGASYLRGVEGVVKRYGW
jgi:phosphatidylserine decarboxylase